jgi:hypothetical protein
MRNGMKSISNKDETLVIVGCQDRQGKVSNWC